MSQLPADVVPSVVDKVVSESEIMVENKSERSSEETIVKKDFMDIFRLRKSKKPPVPPKAGKKSKKSTLENKSETEVDQKIMTQKLNEKTDENQTKDFALTEPAANLVEVSKQTPEMEFQSVSEIIETQEDASSSESKISKQDLTEPQVDATLIPENPTEMQVNPSSVTNTTLPTPVAPRNSETKKQNGSRQDTRTPSYTNLSRRSSASSSTSRSSLGVSAAPSSSSMCHLTELAQPTTVHLESTLARLRRLNANTERVQQHLRDLRNRPTSVLRAKKSASDTKITGSKSLASTRISSLSATTDKSDLYEGPVYEKLTDRLFETLESKLTVKNSAEQLMLPMENDYYRAAYAGLTRIWGQPYTKCSLELHQYLAAELGLLAEAFVMDSTRGMSLDMLQQKQNNGVHFTT